MGLQKYRADYTEGKDANGAEVWFTRWIGGPTMALVRHCPTPFGPRTVYIRGEPDTYFSVPAACTFRRRTITGYVCWHDGLVSFRAHADTVFPRTDIGDQ